MIKIIQRLRPPSWGNFILVAIGIILALPLRYSLLPFKSWDFRGHTGVWYQTIKTQGFSAFASGFSNYTPLYLYCLYIVSVVLPHISKVVATKLPSIAADGVCAWYACRLVGLKYRANAPWAIFACLAVLFAPTVVLNSSFWGQADSVYTAAHSFISHWLR
jgi:Gpi18-like mannosyltransferase